MIWFARNCDDSLPHFERLVTAPAGDAPVVEQHHARHVLGVPTQSLCRRERPVVTPRPHDQRLVVAPTHEAMIVELRRAGHPTGVPSQSLRRRKRPVAAHRPYGQPFVGTSAARGGGNRGRDVPAMDVRRGESGARSGRRGGGRGWDGRLVR